MKTEEILSRYICPLPFNYTEITEKTQHMCCNEWLEEPIGNTDELEKNWSSEISNKIRESILDGSYKYCSKTKCPHLNTLIQTQKPTYGLIPKESFDIDVEYNFNGPKKLKVVFDSACNLACPSCRVDFIKNTPAITEKSNNILEKIKLHYKDSLEELHMSGYGDPFYSTSLFNFLTNFESSWFPKLKFIHLHTNGVLWNEYNWNKLKTVHPYIKSCEISIDAASKEIYEKVRKGGNWDLLIKNLKFIDSIEGLDLITISFVAQKDNYKQIIEFYKMINSIFRKSKIRFQFYKILNWGSLTEDEFNEAAVWKPEHPEYKDFIEQVRKLKNLQDNRIIFNL